VELGFYTAAAAAAAAEEEEEEEEEEENGGFFSSPLSKYLQSFSIVLLFLLITISLNDLSIFLS
jgi:hypothetical protein